GVRAQETGRLADESVIVEDAVDRVALQLRPRLKVRHHRAAKIGANDVEPSEIAAAGHHVVAGPVFARDSLRPGERGQQRDRKRQITSLAHKSFPILHEVRKASGRFARINFPSRYGALSELI